MDHKYQTEKDKAEPTDSEELEHTSENLHAPTKRHAFLITLFKAPTPISIVIVLLLLTAVVCHVIFNTAPLARFYAPKRELWLNEYPRYDDANGILVTCMWGYPFYACDGKVTTKPEDCPAQDLTYFYDNAASTKVEGAAVVSLVLTAVSLFLMVIPLVVALLKCIIWKAGRAKKTSPKLSDSLSSPLDAASQTKQVKTVSTFDDWTSSDDDEDFNEVELWSDAALMKKIQNDGYFEVTERKSEAYVENAAYQQVVLHTRRFRIFLSALLEVMLFAAFLSVLIGFTMYKSHFDNEFRDISAPCGIASYYKAGCENHAADLNITIDWSLPNNGSSATLLAGYYAGIIACVCIGVAFLLGISESVWRFCCK